MNCESEWLAVRNPYLDPHQAGRTWRWGYRKKYPVSLHLPLENEGDYNLNVLGAMPVNICQWFKKFLHAEGPMT